MASSMVSKKQGGGGEALGLSPAPKILKLVAFKRIKFMTD